MGLRHVRGWMVAAGCVATLAGMAGTAAAAPVASGGGRAQVPAEFSASFTVTKLLDDEPASWPVTVQLVEESTLSFDGGGTTATQTTDAETGETTFTVTGPGGEVPEGVTLLITEPVRADGALNSIGCTISSTESFLNASPFSENWFDDGTAVGAYFSLATYQLESLDCTLYNDAPMPLALTKEVDGNSDAAFPLAVIPQTTGLHVGKGAQIDADGIFPTTDGEINEINVAFGGKLPVSESPSTLFIGEALGAGYMFTGVTCDGLEQEVPKFRAGLQSDGPLFLVDGIVGVYVDVYSYYNGGCTISNAIPGLTATKTASVSNPTPGTSFTYTITATNSGRTPLLDATLSDPMPAGISATAATASTGTCTVASGQVDCDLGDLAIGAASTITVNATVGTGATDGQAFVNTATITGQVPEWDPGLSVEVPEVSQETLAAVATTHPVTATASVTISAVVPTTTTQAPTTTAAPTTTVAVAQAAPTTTLPIPVVSPAVLPRTGGGSQLLPIALWTLVAGTGLVVVRRVRRRRPA